MFITCRSRHVLQSRTRCSKVGTMAGFQRKTTKTRVRSKARWKGRVGWIFRTTRLIYWGAGFFFFLFFTISYGEPVLFCRGSLNLMSECDSHVSLYLQCCGTLPALLPTTLHVTFPPRSGASLPCCRPSNIGYLFYI